MRLKPRTDCANKSQVLRQRLAAAKQRDDSAKAEPALDPSTNRAGPNLSGELDAILPEAFAVAREAARRVLGERPYDVQLLGGLVLHQGKIMEMKTGEGKTLSLVAPALPQCPRGTGRAHCNCQRLPG